MFNKRKFFLAYLFISLLLTFITINKVMSQETSSSLDSNETSNILKYTLIEVKTNKLLSTGNIPIKHTYIHNRNITSDSTEKIYFEDHYIKINTDFIIGLNLYGYKQKDNIGGFGMWLRHTNKPSFSWEWYEQIDNNTFKKLQGHGTLKVEYKKRDRYWVISQLTFIGDHVFRAKQKKLLDILNQREDTWHCIIANGSNITW